MREVLRVLKPGGRHVIIAEVYKRDDDDKRLQKLVEMTNMILLNAAEHRELFSSAGFADVQIIARAEKN